MKKIISYIISIILVLGLGVGIFFVVKSVSDNKEYTLTVETGENGSAIVKIDDTPYTITSNLSKDFTVTKKSKIKLKANPNENYAVVSWKANDKEYSTSAEIEITVKKDIKYSVEFEATPIAITITDSNEFNENIEILPTENLLKKLNDTYTAPQGYKYVYKIGENIVTETTGITTATTITRELEIIEYTVTFKNGDTQVGEVQTYTVENKTITVPELPTIENAEHYTISWSEYNLDDLKDIIVTLNKTANPYYVTFKNGETEVAKLEYNIDNQTITEPAFPTFENSKHYNLSWEAYDLSTLENFTVNLIKTAKEYSITFKLVDDYTFDGTNSTTEVKYTLDNYTSVVAPNLPALKDGYTDIKWPEFELTINNLGTIAEIEAIVEYVEYKAKFILPTGITFVDDSTECEATYHITDKTIKCPKTVNVEKHYEIKWVYSLTYDAVNTLEITGTKDYKTYKTTFKLPEGYTFDGTNATKEVSYTLENYSDAEAPELPTVEHYTLAWEKEFTLTEENIGTISEIKAILAPATYYVTFMNGETEVAKLEYNIENKTIEEPEVPAIEHYTTSWEEYSLDSLSNLTVNIVKTAVEYTVTFKHGETEIATATYTIENNKITEPAVPTVKDKVVVWEAYTIPENLGNFTVNAEELIIHTISYKFDSGYNVSDLKTFYLKLAYSNNIVYLVGNTTTSIELDTVAKNLYNDNNKTGQSGWLYLSKIDKQTVNSLEEFTNKFKTALESKEVKTITLTYEENE